MDDPPHRRDRGSDKALIAPDPGRPGLVPRAGRHMIQESGGNRTARHLVDAGCEFGIL